MANGRRAAKYTVVAIILLLVVWVAVNGALMVTGLTGIAVSSQSQGNTVSLALKVPNHSYIPIQGRVVTNVYDAGTGNLIGSGDDSFALRPGTVSPIAISIQITQKTSNPVRVTMDYYVGAYGVQLPFAIRGADVTMAPPTG